MLDNDSPLAAAGVQVVVMSVYSVASMRHSSAHCHENAMQARLRLGSRPCWQAVPFTATCASA